MAGNLLAPLRAIAVQQTDEAVLAAAVEQAREAFLEGAAFAAVPEGELLRMAILSGVTDPRFPQIKIAPGIGLGGYVLDHKQSAAVDDYSHDARFTHDFVEIVSEGEGLHGIICVPVMVHGQPQALLYGARRRVGAIGGRAVRHVERAADYAAIGIQQAQERRHALELERMRDRERLATSLHDSVAQMLFGIGVAARQSLVSGDATALEDAMRQIEQTAADARRELRSTLNSLSDAEDGLGFEARLQGELQLFSSISGCQARLARCGTARALPHLIEDLIVDIAVEGTRNAVKHAGAKHVLVFLEYAPSALKMAIQSEAAEAVPSITEEVESTGYGLMSLTERAERIGATLALGDGEQGLKVLRFELPLRA